MTSLNSLLMIMVIASFVSAVFAFDDDLISQNCTQGFCGIKPKDYEKLQDLMNSLVPDFLKKTYADRTSDVADLPRVEKGSDGCITEYLYEPHTYEYNNQIRDYIVQIDEFKQHFEIVRCAQESIKIVGKPQCWASKEIDGFIGSCITTTAQRKIYVLDSLTKELQLKTYDVPVCCSCQFSTSMDK